MAGATTVSIIKAYDVAHIRFAIPDLESMRTFLTDFGMTDISAEKNRLFMRGYADLPFLYAAEQGENRFLGFGIRANSVADLEKLAEHEGVAVEPLDAPGGGHVVRLLDPDGIAVEVVAGQQSSGALPVPEPVAWNHGGGYPRQSNIRRVGQHPSHVRRLGHVVISVSEYRRSLDWYQERFGLLISDEIQPAPGHSIAAFMRADRGDEPCDHHTVFIAERSIEPGFMHAAYEVFDFDDLMAGHEHLKRAGYTHYWGIGRHFLGSQVFDYWNDPFGNELEHWTDGDQFTARDTGGVGTVEELLGVQWGMEMPPLPDLQG